jgi:hypothetical protein
MDDLDRWCGKAPSGKVRLVLDRTADLTAVLQAGLGVALLLVPLDPLVRVRAVRGVSLTQGLGPTVVPRSAAHLHPDPLGGIRGTDLERARRGDQRGSQRPVARALAEDGVPTSVMLPGGSDRQNDLRASPEENPLVRVNPLGKAHGG